MSKKVDTVLSFFFFFFFSFSLQALKGEKEIFSNLVAWLRALLEGENDSSTWDNELLFHLRSHLAGVLTLPELHTLDPSDRMLWAEFLNLSHKQAGNHWRF